MLIVKIFFILIVAAPFSNFKCFASDTNFETWLTKQKKVSLQKLQLNMHPEGTIPGIIIASPSKSNPNYFYYWIRDANIIVNSLFNQYLLNNQFDSKKMEFFWDDLFLTQKIQQSFALTGLGEPKFYVDGTSYNWIWSRPQNDGPALRALAHIKIAQHLLHFKMETFVKYFLFSPNTDRMKFDIIKKDLDYVAGVWSKRSFDLWEEVYGEHFYTLAVQRKALFEGSQLALRLGDYSRAKKYQIEYEKISNVLTHFWDHEKGLIRATNKRVWGTVKKNSNLDMAIVLAVLHGEVTNDPLLNPLSPQILATVALLEKAFIQKFAINRNVSVGPAMGRYPEDFFMGGNPWYLLTFSMAEFYFKLAEYTLQQKTVAIDPIALKFYAQHFPCWNLGKNQKRNYLKISNISTVRKMAVKFYEAANLYLKQVSQFIPIDGSLSEQYSKNDGSPRSAADLSWSYSAFVDMMNTREHVKLKFMEHKLVP